MKSYLKKNNLHYFTFSPNSEKPIKAVICHLTADTPVEDSSNTVEDLCFKVINVRKTTATRLAPSRQTLMETHPLFLVTLTRNIKFQEIYKLKSLNHIIIKVDLYKAQTGCMHATNANNLVTSELTSSNSLNVCGAVVVTCIGNALKRQIQNLCRAAAFAP
jgi:hypothetical protein